MNIFSPHIPLPELADLAEERSTSSAEARKHLANCLECSNQLKAIRQTIGLMRTDTAEDAPKPLVEFARKIFRAGAAVTKDPSLFKLIIASLTFDSLTVAPTFGLRSQGNSERQLIYSAETADIDVRVARTNDEWQISGQVLGADCANGEAGLEGDNFSASAKLNELCEFSFGAVPAGSYKISVRLPEFLVETPSLELGP